MFASPICLSVPAHIFEYQYAVVGRGRLALLVVLDAYLLIHVAQVNPVAPEMNLAKPVSVLNTCPINQHNGEYMCVRTCIHTHTHLDSWQNSSAVAHNSE